MYKHLALIFWPALAGLFGALLILDRWVLPEQEDRWSERNERVSYARAVRNATPAVVNIYTAKLVTTRRNPILDELRDFVTSIRTKSQPIVSGEDGLAAVAIAHQVQQRVARRPALAPGFRRKQRKAG